MELIKIKIRADKENLKQELKKNELLNSQKMKNSAVKKLSHIRDTVLLPSIVSKRSYKTRTSSKKE